jgi:hypothetical protein
MNKLLCLPVKASQKGKYTQRKYGLGKLNFPN